MSIQVKQPDFKKAKNSFYNSEGSMENYAHRRTNIQRELIEQCNDESIREILSRTDKLVNETKNKI